MNRVICILALLAALVSSSVLRAEEGFCPPEEPSFPVLSRIPYINRLFKTVGPCNECEQVDHQVPVREALPCPNGECSFQPRPIYIRRMGTDGFERIGVDFEFNGPCAAGECSATQCVAAECVGGQCSTGRCVTGQYASAGARPMGNYVEACAAIQGTAGPCDGPTVQAAQVAYPYQHPMLAHMEFLADHNRQLLEALVDSRVEIATLAAKIEFAAEREKLVVENALLKAKASPATVPGEATELAQLRDENAALKAKLATMEERLVSLEQPVKKSADKSATRRKR